MNITADNLPKHELIGLQCEVIASTDESKIGIRGEVLDETKSMLQIKDKEVQKKICTFRFTLPDGEEVKVEGGSINKRPEERIGMDLSDRKSG